MTPNLIAMKALIQNGETESAGQQLLVLAQGSRFANEVIGHLARWKQILSDERKGIASDKDVRMSKNQVIFALLDLITQMEEELPPTLDSLSDNDSSSPHITNIHIQNVSNSNITIGDKNTTSSSKKDEA